MPENTIHRGHGEELGWGWKLALATENLGQKSGVSCGLRGLKVSPHVLSHLGTAKLCATNTASAKVRLATTSNDWWVSKSCCSVYSERPTHKDANLESDPLAVVFFFHTTALSNYLHSCWAQVSKANSSILLNSKKLTVVQPSHNFSHLCGDIADIHRVDREPELVPRAAVEGSNDAPDLIGGHGRGSPTDATKASRWRTSWVKQVSRYTLV